MMVKMLQDCLLLNIYVPAVQAAEKQDAALPVMVWLHDCLLLNIYVPAVQAAEQAAEKQDAALPVMVWLHGGAFLFGQG